MQYAAADYIPAALIATALVAAFFVWVAKRRRLLVSRFTEKSLVASIAPTASDRRKAVKMALVTAAVFLAVFSMARPQWGFEWTEAKLRGLDIMLAVDVSKSMVASDVKPNRLERVKFAVKDMVKKLNGDRVGLIAFAGTAFLQCPLTIDYNGFLLTVDDLNVNTIPRGGTSISGAIREATNVFKGQGDKYKILIIITDGEDLEGDASAAAKDAAGQGMKIFCVGVGTTEGALIPATNEEGERGWVADRSGQVVKSRLNEDLLKEIALSTGGSYVRATQSDFGLVLLYDKSISKMEKKDLEAKKNKKYHERFQYFLALAVLILLVEPFISERKRV